MIKSPSSLLAAVGAMVVICLPLVTPAMAGEGGFYVGANAGRVLRTYQRKDLDNGLIDAFSAGGFDFATSSVEKEHVMWSADVGYMFSENFGVEASYLNLGALRYTGFGTRTRSGSTETIRTDIEVKSHGPALALVGALPMSNLWVIDARVGAYQGKVISTYQSNFASGRDSKTSTGLMAGVGTALTVTSHCLVRLDYLRVQDLKDEVFEKKFNVELVTVGVAFVF